MAPRTGAKFRNGDGTTTKQAHHCGECGKPPTAQCFKKSHVTYCEVCGEKFNVISPSGCANHGYREGYNLGIRNIRRGLDPDYKSDWELQQEAKAQAEAAVEEQHNTYRRPGEDWSRLLDPEPHYREKRPPKKTNNKQGKKQGKALDLKSLKAAEKKHRKI